MNYSKKTLISDWDKNREAEPKHYDMSACGDGHKNLHKSTYRYFGTHLDTDWRTTTQMSQSEKMHEVKDIAKSMVQPDNFHSLVFDRETTATDATCKSFLSCCHPISNENELITSYALDYIPPQIFTNQSMQPKELKDRKLDFRRHQSQFTDVADYRRWGRNTWQDFNDDQAVVQGAAKTLYRQINLSCS